MDASGTLLAPTTPLRKDKGISRLFDPLFWHRRKHLVGFSMKIIYWVGRGAVLELQYVYSFISFHFNFISF